MKKIMLLFFLGTAVFIIWLPADSGHALEYTLGAEVFEGLFVEDNYLDASTATFDYDETYNILGVYPEVYLNFNSSFKVFALVELEWFHTWDAEIAEDENDIDATMANMFINYSKAGFTLDAGLQPFAVGRGVVFYSDEPGVSIRYDGWRRVYIKGEGLRVFDHSSMATLAVGYKPGFLESVEIVGAWYHDADDGIAELYQPFYEDTTLESSGDLFWTGLQAEFFVYDLYISALMMQQFGSVELDDGTDLSDFDISAYLVDLEAGYNISGQLSVGVFFFSASGDSSPMAGNLHAFMSPMPFNPRTSIFFNGGFARYDIEEAVLLGGVTWDGVSAPGIRFEYQPNYKVDVKLVGAMLFPQSELFDSARWYGWEADMRVSYEFYKPHQLFVEAGLLTHGNYFEKLYGIQPDHSARVVTGFSLVF